MDNFAQILGEAGLPEELLTSLQEAFDSKVAEAREQAEMSIREEFAARYEHDKATLVEAMDRMLTDVVEKHANEKVAEVAKLQEARSKFTSAVKEARAHYKAKLSEHVSTSQTFVVEQLTKKLKSLTVKEGALAKKQTQLDEAFEAVKAEMVREQAARLKKIDEFVVRQVSRELNEFAEDHRALVETRVKLGSESKQRLAETQKRFVRESAKKVDAIVTETLKREMVQLHEDLERNRQNMFGRRIFEAVAAEFMTSYLAEGTEVRKLQDILESKDQELAAAKGKLTETAKAVDAIVRKAKLAEERAARTKIMSELLSNLRGEKKNVMESMLETVKTDNLRTAFDRLLPVVLSEGTRKPQSEKKVLSEKSAKRTTTITGDKGDSRLTESVETETDAEIAQDLGVIIRLAGLSR